MKYLLTMGRITDSSSVHCVGLVDKCCYCWTFKYKILQERFRWASGASVVIPTKLRPLTLLTSGSTAQLSLDKYIVTCHRLIQYPLGFSNLPNGSSSPTLVTLSLPSLPISKLGALPSLLQVLRTYFQSFKAGWHSVSWNVSPDRPSRNRFLSSKTQTVSPSSAAPMSPL